MKYNLKDCRKLRWFKVKGLSTCFALTLRMHGERIAQSLAVTVPGQLMGSHFFEYQQRMTTKVQTAVTTLLWL